MYCDYVGLADYANVLSKNFSSVTKAMANIEVAIDSLSSSFNWDAETKDYFLNLYKNLQDNFNLINERFDNIKKYVDVVISNYQTVDTTEAASFGG